MKPGWHLRALVASVALLSFAGWAQEADRPMSVLDAQRLVEQLNAALEERDAVILELAARVRVLEQAQSSSAAPAPVEFNVLSVGARNVPAGFYYLWPMAMPR